MKCMFIHNALSAVDTAEEEGYIDLDHRLASQLGEMGLVSSYTTWFYQEMQSSAVKLERTWKRLDGVPEKSKRAEELKREIDKLEAMPEPEGYKPTFDGNYVRLSERGQELRKRISAALPRLENTPLEDFEREVEHFQSRIETQYSRFIEMLALMVKEGFRENNTEVNDCAVHLSTIDGGITEIYERMWPINYYLYNKGWNNYDRLKTVATVAMQPGDSGNLKEGLVQSFLKLVESLNFSKNYYTWWEASAVMEIHEPSLEGKVSRFDAVRKALGEKGWKPGSASTCYNAANLARGQGEPEALAENHMMLELKLVERGRNSCRDSGIAALILMDGEGTADERADRFVEAFMTMHDYGWEKNENYYPTAAFVSLLPGTVEENVQWLEDIYERLKETGFTKNLTYRAVALLRAVYSGQFKEEVIPRIIVSAKAF